MGKKTFSDLNGVIAVDENGKEVTWLREHEPYNIKSLGETIFKVNPSNLTIDKYTVKRRVGRHCFFVCKHGECRDYMTIIDSNYRLVSEPPFEKIVVIPTRKYCGLFHIKLEDAIECTKRLQEKRYFGALQHGDTVYMANKGKKEVSAFIVDYVWHNSSNEFCIYFQNSGHITCPFSEYECNTSRYSDRHFRTSTLRNVEESSRFLSFHMCEIDALKVIKQYDKSVKERIKKNEESFELGKLIKQKDASGNELHIGDTVVYAKRNSLFSSKFTLSTATVMGDSGKTKITVFDESEKNNKEEDNGIHRVESPSVYLLQKTNVE